MKTVYSRLKPYEMFETETQILLELQIVILGNI